MQWRDVLNNPWGVLGVGMALWVLRGAVKMLLISRRSSTPGLSLWTSLKNLPNIAQTLKEWMEQKGEFVPWYHLWLGTDFTMVASDPDSAQWVLRKGEIGRADFVGLPRTFNDMLGRNIAIADGVDWRRHRAALSCGFNEEAYRSYYPAFNEVTEKCLNIFRGLPEGVDLDISTYFTKFTLDLLGKSIFHYDFKYLEMDDNPYYKAYRTIMLGGGPLNQLLVELIPGWSYCPFFGPKRFKEACELMRTLFKNIIQEHQNKDTHYEDLLDKLLKFQSVDHTLSDLELYSNIWALFVAGHETTATALSWAFAELADKQDLQERLYQHILTEFPTGTPSIEAILHPPTFLDCFIKENLRHHPPGSIVPTRRVGQELQCGQQRIPAGCRVAIDIWAVHHNPKYWKNPSVFEPDRFLPERRKGMHRFAYIPFSLGPRQCIGNEFSEIEQRVFLVKCLREFKILPPRDLPKVDLNTIPPFGAHFTVNLTLQRRKN